MDVTWTQFWIIMAVWVMVMYSYYRLMRKTNLKANGKDRFPSFHDIAIGIPKTGE